MNSLKKGDGVPLLNFESCPGVPLLNFRGVPGSWFYFYTALIWVLLDQNLKKLLTYLKSAISDF